MELVHEIQKNVWLKDFFWGIMKVPYTKNIRNLFQGPQFFVTERSLNHVVDKWKKIIQFGKKSWTNMPFH